MYRLNKNEDQIQTRNHSNQKNQVRLLKIQVAKWGYSYFESFQVYCVNF